MQALAERFLESDVQFVGLTKQARDATDQQVLDFLKETRVQFPVGRDKGDSSDHYKVKGVPAVAVLKGDRIVWRGHPAHIQEANINEWISPETSGKAIGEHLLQVGEALQDWRIAWLDYAEDKASKRREAFLDPFRYDYKKVKEEIYQGHRTTEASFLATISLCADWLNDKPLDCVLPCGIEGRGQVMYFSDRRSGSLDQSAWDQIKQRTLHSLPDRCK